MINQPSFLLAAAAGLLCCLTWACSTAPELPEDTPIDLAKKKWQAHETEIRESLKESASLSAIKPPLLKSSFLEKKWGKPEISTTSTGVYRLYYDDPSSSFDNFTVYGSPTPLVTFDGPPPPIGGMGTATPQDWKTVEIMGQSVRYFILSSGGNGGDIWATESFSLTAPDGGTGHYRLETEFNDFDPPERFSKVDW